MRFLIAVTFVGLLPQIVAAQTLQEFSPRKPAESQIVVFASGNAKSVLAQPKDATSATGSVGMTFIGTNFIISGAINIPAKSDTVTSGFGASMLAPASGTTTSALLDVRWPTAFSFTGCQGIRGYLCKTGVHTYFGTSGTRWGLNPDNSGHPTTAEDVSLWAAGAGLSYTFFDGWIDKPDSGARVGMALDVLGSLRTIRGNLGMPADSAERTALLDSRARAYGGAEFGLNMRYNEMNAALTYYQMAGSVRGFSGGQVVAAISFRTTVNFGKYVEPQ